MQREESAIVPLRRECRRTVIEPGKRAVGCHKSPTAIFASVVSVVGICRPLGHWNPVLMMMLSDSHELGDQKIEYRREVAGGTQQYETVPNGILESQSLPEMEDDAHRI